MAKNKPKKHPQEDYANHLAQYFGSLTPVERLVDDKLNDLRSKSMTTFSDKSDRTTAEINEYDRQRFGFTALAVSLIVGGLLSNQIPGEDTLASRWFFLICVGASLLCILFIFIEYSKVFRFFKKSNDATQKILEYIASNKWKDSEALNKQVAEMQKDVPINSPRTVQLLEIGMLLVAILFLLLWLMEKLFNPQWAFWIH